MYPAIRCGKDKIKPRLKVGRELWRGELCEMTMLMAAVSRMTTVNKPVEADLHCHPTRGKSHTGQVPKDIRLWFAVLKWIADLFGAGVGKWRVQAHRPRPCRTYSGSNILVGADRKGPRTRSLSF